MLFKNLFKVFIVIIVLLLIPACKSKLFGKEKIIVPPFNEKSAIDSIKPYVPSPANLTQASELPPATANITPYQPSPAVTVNESNNLPQANTDNLPPYIPTPANS